MKVRSMTRSGSDAPTPSRTRSMAFRIAALALGASTLGGCIPVIVGGALVGGSLVATDRRTSGTQVEDEVIELKSIGRLNEVLGDRARVSTTSYNRMVLLTGEVADDKDKTAAELAVARIDNVKSVVNEINVGDVRTMPGRTNDSFTTAKVKASLVDAKDLFANSIKVVTNRGVVYMMGRLTEREAGRATEVARGVAGVTKVVRVFDVISEEELAKTEPRALAKP